MTRIGLLSDTHGYFDPQLIDLFKDCDEIWHAGDVGNHEVHKALQKLRKTIRMISGNIDGKEIRVAAPEELSFKVENRSIFMKHIGGYPDRYPPAVKKQLIELKPDIFVCGHSHILRVIYDKKLNVLYLNPGAAGKEGFHVVRTALRFTIDTDKVKDMEVIELGSRP